MKTKIIALHGLIGAGKDCVTTFIKMHLFFYDRLTNNVYSISRKEELMSYAIANINNQNWLLEYLPGVKIDRFAAPLKTLIAGFLGISPDELYSQESKTRELDSDIWYAPGKPNVSIRDLHTDISDAIKNVLNNDIFSNTCIDRCLSNDIELAIVNDLRFDNELQALIKNGAYLVKIQRPSAERQQRKVLEEKGIIHMSEYGLPNDSFNYVIRNDSTYQDLSIKVLDMLLDAGLVSNKYVKHYKNYNN